MHFEVLGEFNSHLADVQEEEMVDEGKTKTYESAMKICIKSADVSHPARAASLHLRWTKDVIEEFFLQVMGLSAIQQCCHCSIRCKFGGVEVDSHRDSTCCDICGIICIFCTYP